MSDYLCPPPLSPFSGQKNKEVDFFICIPIEPECSEMDNFEIKKKIGCGRPPRQIYITEKCF